MFLRPAQRTGKRANSHLFSKEFSRWSFGLGAEGPYPMGKRPQRGIGMSHSKAALRPGVSLESPDRKVSCGQDSQRMTLT